jgi:surface polysaccharide O-acyltransferase-like enzyme
MSLLSLAKGGAAYHLWFLPALAIGLVLNRVCAMIFPRPVVGLLFFALAAIGIMQGGWHILLGSNFPSGRGGLLIAPMFIWLGKRISEKEIKGSPIFWFGAIAASYCCLLIEGILLSKYCPQFGGIRSDFLFSTIPFGVAVFCFSVCLPENGVVLWLSGLGRLSLGIYLIHVAILWIVDPHQEVSNLTSAMLNATTAFVIAAAFTTLGRRYSLTRKLLD